MSASPRTIKVIVAAGVSVADAIRASLPGTLAQFARRHGFQPSQVSRCIHGHAREERVRDALASEFAVEREWLDELLDQNVAARQAVA